MLMARCAGLEWEGSRDSGAPGRAQFAVPGTPASREWRFTPVKCVGESAVWGEWEIACVECGAVCDGDWFDGAPRYPQGRWLLLTDGRVFHMHGYTSAHPTEEVVEEVEAARAECCGRRYKNVSGLHCVGCPDGAGVVVGR